MPKYRHDLPQLKGKMFLTDGGMETKLMFHDGILLPHFASFVLLESEDGRNRLRAYYRRYLAIARGRDAGFVLEGMTWRANADWGEELGYDASGLADMNRRSIAFLEDLRSEWEQPEHPCVISGSIGPRGDGYKAGLMNSAEAEDYHSAQIETLASTEADLVSAYTLTNVDEAMGIARAARNARMPCMISFTVETDGRLVTGRSLRDAIETVDDQTGGYPAYYMINCAHPTHFEQALEAGENWMRRIAGVRANASTRSHAELDESETLDPGDPEDLAARYLRLTRKFPAMRILGGCCGTDHRHVAAICEACVPRMTAMSA